MSNLLSDEEIEAMEDGGLGWTNGSYLHALCAQAKEANRLREGLIRLKIDILAEELSGQSWPSMKTVERIRELSGDEE